MEVVAIPVAARQLPAIEFPCCRAGGWAGMGGLKVAGPDGCRPVSPGALGHGHAAWLDRILASPTTFSLVRRAYVTARRRGCRLLLKGTACSVKDGYCIRSASAAKAAADRRHRGDRQPSLPTRSGPRPSSPWTELRAPPTPRRLARHRGTAGTVPPERAPVGRQRWTMSVAQS